MSQKRIFLIEIMIVISIISILSAIEILGYYEYIQKESIIDMLQTILPYKNSIEIFSLNRGTLIGCDAGNESIPINIKGKYIKAIDVKSCIMSFTADKNLSGLSATLISVIQLIIHHLDGKLHA